MTWAQRVVDGFEGGAVVLPCTVSIQGDLTWRSENNVLLIRLANGSAFPPENSYWKNVISFVGSSNNLRISPLSHQRDDSWTFWCEDAQGGGRQSTTVRVSAPAVFQNHPGKVLIALGKSDTVSILFYAWSSSGRVRVRWVKAGESDALQPHREEPSLVSLIVYGQQVSLPGTVTVLTLTDVRQADKGNYSVTVTSDINDVIQTSQTNVYVDVTVNSDPTGAIIGGVIGSLVCGVIVTAIALILWRRSKTTGSSGDGQDRQISAIGEVSGEVRALPRLPETTDGSAVVQVQNYKTLALNNPQSPGTRDQQYEALAVLRSAGGITHENSPDTRTRTGQTVETSYENVSSM